MRNVKSALKVCKICNKKYMGYGNSRYCSKKCWKENRNRKRRRYPISKKLCKFCGKGFIGNVSKIYCSYVCYYNSQRNRMREINRVKHYKNCKMCGREFGGHKHQNYCGKCLKHRRKLNIGRRHKKICKSCGNAYDGISNQKYCGTECRRIDRNKINRIRSMTQLYGKEVVDLRQKVNKCYYCDWSDTFEIHHKNKNRKDNRLKNILILCPNHHSLFTRGIWKYSD